MDISVPGRMALMVILAVSAEANAHWWLAMGNTLFPPKITALRVELRPHSMTVHDRPSMSNF